MIGSYIQLQLVSADCAGILDMLNRARIPVYDVRYKDDLTLSFRISNADLSKCQKIIYRSGGNLRIIATVSKLRSVSGLIKRPVMVFGLLLVAILTFLLPTRIFFVKVVGNEQITDRLILERAELCGISFGASRRGIKSEQVKNRLLEELPQLQWVGVNTYGCTAVISVSERECEDNMRTGHGVSSIVAARDGIIESCTATKGNLICKPGQAVKAGQVLVSGYTDCGLSIRASQSEGEIYAQTIHALQVFVPADWDQKGDLETVRKKYSLIIGKKRINFYKDSGILEGTCDKMYTEYVLTLPGGFQLPVALLVEEQTWRSVRQTSAQMQDVSGLAQEIADNYLNAQMISGKILSANLTEELNNGVYVLNGAYRCSEMIGRVRSEEIVQGNE